MTKAYVVGTCDTKGEELDFAAGLLRAARVDVVVVDVGTRSRAGFADVPSETVAGHHPDGRDAVLEVDDRGRAVAAMAVAFEHFAASRHDIGGMLGLGGSGGTALITPGMRALPVGVPKVMVSTVASGNVAAYVGPSDICMMYSVTDVAGLNRISRAVIGNAAHALAGMMRHAVPAAEADKPAIGLTMARRHDAYATTPSYCAMAAPSHSPRTPNTFSSTASTATAFTAPAAWSACPRKRR